MSSTTGKTPKLFSTAPKVTPRPTAASAARAARNATNRNLIQQQQVRSPSRSSLSPSKAKPVTQRCFVKSESKTDTKANLDIQLNESVENSKTLINQPSENDIDKFAVELKSEEARDASRQLDTIIDESENDRTEIDFTIITEPINKSRPQTPVAEVLKKSVSRPVTPRTTSRPSTPTTSALSRNASRPNTPQQPRPNSRPKTPASSASAPVRVSTPESSRATKNSDDIKVAFSTKQRQFSRMKKELDFKQQAILEVYDSLRDMHSRLNQEGVTGGGEGSLDQELVLFNVADWTSAEISQLCKDAAESSCCDNAAEVFNNTCIVDESSFAELNNKVQDIPAEFANLCFQAITGRQELMSWVKELIERHNDGSGESVGKMAYYNTQGLQLCEQLRDLKNQSDSVVETVNSLMKRAYHERNTLVTVGESLLREVARLRQDLEARVLVANVGKEMDHGNIVKSLENEIRRELEEEKLAKSALKEKLASTESQLRQTRIRISRMDRQLRESEASIASHAGIVKTLEDQNRQKDVQLEVRVKKMKESMKTGEVVISQLTQQKEALQERIKELEEKLKTITYDHELAIKELNKQISNLHNDLEEQVIKTNQEITTKEEIISKLNESNKKVEELTETLTKLKNLKPNTELPTEREIHLIAELQATKETLRLLEDEMESCKKDKVRYLETFSKITGSDNKTAIQQKLAAELLSKNEVVTKMEVQLRDLGKRVLLYEGKLKHYAQYVKELQAHNRAIANSQEASDVLNYQDLQQEVKNLQISLLEASHNNEKLTELLAEKEQKLEQHDKTARAQARDIKVREELINLLKNKETEQSRELQALQQDLEHRMKIVDQVNKQIAAKAEEIQELFATQESKQQQIHRLEKIVLALEEQQKRSQAQRTRHEEKIAALEHELADGNRRERKFLFF